MHVWGRGLANGAQPTVSQFWNQRAQAFRDLYITQGLSVLLRRGMLLREQRALALMRTYSDPTLLDLGCGPGRQVIAAVQQGASYAVGVDAAPQMITLAKAGLSAAHLDGRAHFVEQDIHTFQDERRFDLVWALGVFDYETDPDALLHTMVQHARGHIAASFRRAWTLRAPLRTLAYRLRGCPIFFHRRHEIEALFHRHGLQEVKVEKISSLYFASGRVPTSTSPASSANHFDTVKRA